MKTKDNFFKKNAINFFIFLGVMFATFISCSESINGPNSKYIVTFVNSGVSGDFEKKVTAGATVAEPVDLAHICYSKVEWYVDESFNSLYNFNEPVNRDITLYSKWSEESTVSVSTDGVYQICNWKQLQWIAKSPDRLGNKYFLLNDIVFPDPGQDGFPEYGFIPIGYDTGANDQNFDGTAFSGIFDGGGYSIKNLFIDTTYGSWTNAGAIVEGVTLDDEYIGLFGYVDSVQAEIKNLIVEIHSDNVGVGITSFGDYVGGLVGYVRDGTINKVVVKGGKVLGGSYVGGLLGRNRDTIVGYATVDVMGSGDYVGGLIGFNEGGGGVVTGYFTGKVSGNGNNIGGLVGENRGTAVGYSVGSVIATGNNIGGLIGYNNSGITTGYSTSIVVSPSDDVGGLLGKYSSGPVTGYWDKASTLQNTSAGDGGNIIGISATKNIVTVEVGYSDSFDDTNIFDLEDFISVFDTENGVAETWPKLKDFPMEQPIIDSQYVNFTGFIVTFNTYGGSEILGQVVPYGSTITQPDVIHSCYATTTTGWYTDSDFTTEYVFGEPVTNNFDLHIKWDLTPNLVDGRYKICNWQQLQWIAGYGVTFDERTNRLSKNYYLENDIIFPEAGTDGFPLYGFVPIGYDTGEIPEFFNGQYFTGGFDGNGKTIKNFFINADHASWPIPSVDDEYLGLFGYTQSPDSLVIKDLTIEIHNDGITGKSYLGGLAGYARSIIRNVVVTGGPITGYNRVGGLVGYIRKSISNSYASVAVSGNSSVGGLSGYVISSTVDGYATGSVTSSATTGNSYTGGLVGYSIVSEVYGYATGTVQAGGNNVGGLIGYSSASKVIGYSTSPVSGKDSTGGLVGTVTSSTSYGQSATIGFATGEVSGGNYVGGLIGFNYGISTGYSVGTVSGTGDDVGGLIGLFQTFSTDDDAVGYWDMAASSRNTSAGQATVGVSDTMNIVYSEGIYTDSGNSNNPIFNAEAFTNAFAITMDATNRTWPKLNSSHTIGTNVYVFDKDQPVVKYYEETGKIETIWEN